MRSLGHHLQPIVLVGKDGLSEGLLQSLDVALGDHELVKVRLGENADGDRHVLAEELARAGRADLAGVMGRTVLLYRKHPTEPKIVLPGARRR